MKKYPSRIKRIIFTLLACFLFFIFLEAGTRIYKSLKHRDPRWLSFGFYFPIGDKQIKLTHGEQPVKIKVTQRVQKDGYYLFKPGEYNMKMLGQQEKKVTINSLGFRGREISRQKPEGITRIICLGGSAVYGINLEDEQTYPSLLEKSLGGGFEVINAGFQGAKSSTILALFKSEILELEPDIVIVYTGCNEHSAKLEAKGSSIYYLQILHRLFYNYSLFYTLATEKMSLYLSGQPDPGRELWQTAVFDQKRMQGIINLYRDNLIELLELSRQNNIKLIFVTQPVYFPPTYPRLGDETKIRELQSKKRASWTSYTYLMQSKLMQQLRDIGSEYNTTVVDGVKSFEEMPYLKWSRLFFDAVHLTVQGNESLAKILSDYIKTYDN